MMAISCLKDSEPVNVVVLKALEKSKNISHWGHPCFEEVSLVGFLYLVFNARQVELQ